MHSWIYICTRISKSPSMFFSFFFNFSIQQCSWPTTFTFWSNHIYIYIYRERERERVYNLYIHMFLVSCMYKERPESPSLPSNFKDMNLWQFLTSSSLLFPLIDLVSFSFLLNVCFLFRPAFSSKEWSKDMIFLHGNTNHSCLTLWSHLFFKIFFELGFSWKKF